MNITLLIEICEKAWTLPILAEMRKGQAGRQAALVTATGASRGAFTASLSHLMSLGLVEKTKGYGHPLRPEFQLTETGQKVADFAVQLDMITGHEMPLILRKRWTLPVLGSCLTPIGFRGLLDTLPITDRALSQSLKSLEAVQWVDRHVDIECRPPRPIYQSANTGALISQLIETELAQK